MTMPKNVISFPQKPATHSEPPLDTSGSRVILSVGQDRYAIDLTTTMTELSPTDAEIVPIETARTNASVRRPPPGGSRRLAKFPLALSAHQSDESSCAERAERDNRTNMTNNQAIAEQAASAAARGAHVGAQKGSSQKVASPRKGAPNGQKAANKAKRVSKLAKAAKPAKKDTRAARQGSKTVKILELIRRANGATLKEIMKATGWQAHSVRGFVSGTLVKKLALKVDSAKREDGQRVYSIAK